MAESINPYASSTSPQDTSVRRWAISPWFVVAMVLGLLLFACLLFVPPGFIEIYEDFEVELPLLSRIAIHWSLPAIVLVVTLLFAVKEFLPISAGWKRRLNLAMALAVMIVGLLFAFALLTPLVHLISDLN